MLLALLCITLARPVFSQTLGSITGEALDATAAPIPGVAVQAANTGTGAVRSTTTNEAGVYAFPSLPPGVYTVQFEKTGFKTQVRKDFELHVQDAARIDLRMELGNVSESIEVEAASTQIATDNATVGTVIENRRIVELPLNGRNYLQLVSLSPNVSTGFAGQGQSSARQGGIRAGQTIAVGGQRTNFNHYTLDGVENTDPNFNTFIVLPSIDALEEFKVQTGVYPAEFGRESAQINVSTKSGTNKYHGALFEFLRNEKLDAASYAFTALRPAKDPFKWNQYGFVLSGPVRIPHLINGKDKLFFMSNYEAYRKRGSVSALFSLASAPIQGGDFSGIAAKIYDPTSRVLAGDGKTITATPFTGNIIPPSRISPISMALLQYYAKPTLSGSTNNFNESLARPDNRDQYILRMDYVESPKSAWSGRYSWGDENSSSPGLNLNGTKLLTNFEQYAGSNTRVLSPSIVTETRFGYTRFYNSVGTLLAGVRNVVDELKIPGLAGGDPVTWGIPSVGIANYTGIGDSTDGPFVNNNRSLQFLNNTTIVHGKHTFRFGAEFRRDQYNQDGNQFGRGNFTFSTTPTLNPATNTGGDAFASFLLGNITLTEVAAQIASVRYRQTTYYLYLDDTWKVTPHLTLSLGLRYENTPPWTDQSGNLITVFYNAYDTTPNVADQSRYPIFLRQGKGTGDPYAGIRVRWPNIPLVQDGRLGDGLVQRDNNDFAPRIGIAWSPNEKWSFRMAGGTFYNQDQGNPWFDVGRNAAGRSRNDDNPSFPAENWNNALGAAGAANAIITTPQAFSMKFDRRTPYSNQYLFNVQHQMSNSLTVEAGYLGSVSRHLESYRAVSAAVPGPGTPASRSPYPNFGLLVLIDDGSNGDYNSLGTKLTKRYSRSLTTLVSYTWSKSIDETSGIRTQDSDTLFWQNGNCMRCERGLSSFDVRHRLSVSGLYDLPVGKGRGLDLGNAFADAVVGGWQMGSIVTWRSGFPINPSAGVNRSNTNINVDRPDATGISQSLDNRSPAGWFNTAAFQLAPIYNFGNAGRNSITGPPGFSLDFSLHKDFPMFKENHKLQLRMEAFNFLNHPVWGAPNTNFSSPQFGKISSTNGSMRQMQIALKYVF